MHMEEPDLDVYSSIFNQHLQETQEHLRRTSPIQVPTIVIGPASWTPTEIDSFFHALAVHSRLRPDLISASVRTKNIFEVVEYLDLLESDSRRVGRQLPDYSETPIAYEMSEDWISWEETQAQSLLARESSLISKTNESGASQSRFISTGTGSSLCGILVGSERDYLKESPSVSRRRLQKRMSMRRKRARERGEEVNVTASLLKPGPRSNGHLRSRVKKSNKTSSKPMPSETHTVNSQHDQPIPEVEQPSSGIDTGFLENEERFIHAPNLRDFLRFYIGLHDNKLLDGTEDISLDVIELLTSMTQDFVSDIVYRAIVLQEEHKAMKQSIKVWRQYHHDDDTPIIKRSTIQQCLESMSLGTRTRKQYFWDLLTSFDLQTSDDQDLPQHQTEFTPPLNCEYLPRSSGSCNEPTRISYPMDEICDDSALATDDRLDQKDSAADWAHEVDLWNKISQRRIQLQPGIVMI